LTIAGYLPIVIAGLLPYVLPLGFLLGVVATFGRLAADNEWTAIRMAGFHPLRTLAPALALGAALSLVTFALVTEALPKLKRKEAEYRVAALQSVVKNLSPGRTELAIDRFFLSSAFRDGQAFVDAVVYVPDPQGGESKYLRADRVWFSFPGETMRIHLRNARFAHDDLAFHVENPTFELDLAALMEPGSQRFQNPRYRSSRELWAAAASGELTGEPLRKVRYALHDRIATSAACLLFVLLGAPTGLILRRGTQLAALTVAIAYALAYYVLSMRLGKQISVDLDLVPPVVGAWTTSAIALAASVPLLRIALWR
jgi:lipopolysaccharide export LptBFGC system permease protein LptF